MGDVKSDEEEDASSLEAMHQLVQRAEGTRTILESWIKANLRPKLHYGIIPVDGQEASKPTLLKPGAEVFALLFRWLFHFTPNLDAIQMYGPGKGHGGAARARHEQRQ